MSFYLRFKVLKLYFKVNFKMAFGLIDPLKLTKNDEGEDIWKFVTINNELIWAEVRPEQLVEWIEYNARAAIAKFCQKYQVEHKLQNIQNSETTIRFKLDIPLINFHLEIKGKNQSSNEMKIVLAKKLRRKYLELLNNSIIKIPFI